MQFELHNLVNNQISVVHFIAHGGSLQPCRIVVAQGHDLCVRMGKQGGNVGILSPPACADKSDTCACHKAPSGKDLSINQGGNVSNYRFKLLVVGALVCAITFRLKSIDQILYQRHTSYPSY